MVVPIDAVDETYEPIAHRTHSRVSALSAASRTFPPKFIERWVASEVLHVNQWEPIALSVLDTETGQTLEPCALRRHPRLANTWNTSYSNKLVRLYQGIGTDPKTPPKNY